MPTIAPGSSQTINLTADQAVQVSTTGLAYVDLVSGAPGSPYDSRRVNVGVPQTFGPYGVAASIRVRAVDGALTHDAALLPSLTAQEVGQFRGLVSTPGNASVPTAAILGDSNSVWKDVSAFSNATRSYIWASYLEGLAMQQLRIVYNGAVNGSEVLVDAGQTDPCSVQIDKLMASPHWASLKLVFSMFMTNDADGDPADAVAEYETQLLRLKGKTVYVMTPYARGGAANTAATSWDANTPLWVWLLRVRDLIITRLIPNLAAAGVTVRLVDTYAVSVDPESAVGAAATGMLYTEAADLQIHSTNRLAHLATKAVVAKLRACGDIGGDIDWIVSNAYSASLGGTSSVRPRNIFSNGLMVNSGGGLATGFTTPISGTFAVTPSIINPSSTGYGRQQRLAITSTDATGYARYQSPQGSAYLAAGDRVFTQALVRFATAPVNVSCVRLAMSIIIGGQQYDSYALQTDSAKQVAYAEPFEMLLRTPMIELPASGSVTNAISTVTAFGAGAVNANLDIGQFEGRIVL